MTASPTFTPNLEERLSAAAFVILTDDNSHSHEAERWAVRFLRHASGGKPTEFQDHIRAERVRGSAQGARA